VKIRYEKVGGGGHYNIIVSYQSTSIIPTTVNMIVYRPYKVK